MTAPDKESSYSTEEAHSRLRRILRGAFATAPIALKNIPRRREGTKKKSERRDGAKLSFGGDDVFHLTIAGARKAILKGERLDLEDFAAPQLRESAQ